MNRPLGSLSVDPTGNANYSYPIDVPPGIGTDNEPNLQLTYSQAGEASGICGLRWSLAGLSSIFCTPPTAAIDGNPSVAKLKIQLPYRYALDGSPLLCTSGVYGGKDAVYSTQSNASEEIRGSADVGFTVTDDDGRVREYGSSADSVTRGSDGMPVEWKLKKASDCFGNYVSYNYTTSPRLTSNKQPSTTTASHVSCIDNIRYTSNDKAGHVGRLFVNFYYAQRRDIALSSTYGTTNVMAHRLEQIETGVVATDNTLQLARAYRVSYMYSPDSGDSLIESITELGSKLTGLTPTRFTYSTNNGQMAYDYSFRDMTHFYNLNQTTTVIPVDIRGKNKGDIVTIQRNKNNGSSQLVSYFAESTNSGKSTRESVHWTQSSGFRAYAALPALDPNIQPNVLAADLNRDGRTDIIIPFKDPNGRLVFSVSRARTQGFDNAIIIPSGQQWHSGSKFLAIDTNGNGFIDIVEIIYYSSRYCEMLTYFDIYRVRDGQLPIVVKSLPWYERGRTLEWIPIRHHITGSTGLVHVADSTTKQGRRELTATTFTSTSGLGEQAKFEKRQTVPLLEYDYSDGSQRSVLSSDINGDGTQDLVVCTVQSLQGWFSFGLTTFIHDGSGNFKKQQNNTFRMKNDMVDTSKKGSFISTTLDNGRYPSVGYLYPDSAANSWVLLSGRGNAQGYIADFKKTTLFSAITAPIESFQLTQADLSGDGVPDWLAYRITGSNLSLCPIYSTLRNVELLTSVTNPLGLKQTIEYASMNSSIYDPGVNLQTYAAPDDTSDAVCLGGNSQLVSSVTETHDPSVNVLTHMEKCSYTYRQLKLSRSNLGFLGFSSVSRLDENAGIRTTTTYRQDWPFVGFPERVDIYGSSEDNLKQRARDLSPLWKGDPLILIQSAISTLTSTKRTSPNDVPVVVLRVSRQETQKLDSNGKISSITGKRLEYRGETLQKTLEASYTVDPATGTTLSELFTRFRYNTATAGVKNLISVKKISSVIKNDNFDVFEAGDFSLTRFKFSSNSALSGTEMWSTDLQKFVSSARETNDYGLETSVIDPIGLTSTTIYGADFPQYATSMTGESSGVRTIEMNGYDPRFGTLIASISDEGVLTTETQDQWGRTWLKQITAAGKDGSLSAVNNIEVKMVVLDSSLKPLLAQTLVESIEERSYDMGMLSKKFCGKATTFYNDSTKPRRPEIELVDGLGRPRRTVQQDDGQPQVYCSSATYDAAGKALFKSLPYMLTDVQNIDQPPKIERSTCKVVDALGRDFIVIRPRSNDRLGWVGVQSSYSNGGRRRDAEVHSMETMNTLGSSSIVAASKVSQEFVNINGQDRLTATTNSSGKKTTYTYDALGRLITMIDPNGKTETRKYNSLDSIVSIDDPYQNPLKRAQGVVQSYDSNNRLVKEINAIGQVKITKYDALGRRIEVRGDMDGGNSRTTSWTYASSESGQNLLSSVKILQGDGNKIQLAYDYKYDSRGRVTITTLTAVDKTWTTKYSYDRQDNLTAKVFPDGSRLENTYAGTLLIKSVMISADGQSWKVNTTNESYNGFSVPEISIVKGEGDLASKFRSSTKFDANGAVQKLALQQDDSEKFLAGLEFVFNDMDQIISIDNIGNSEKTSYEYRDQRLIASRGKGFERSYAHNDSGELILKDGMKIDSTILGDYSQITGSKNGQTIIASKSNAAGRVVERQVGDGPVIHMSYDENGKMSSATSTNGTKTFISNHDLENVVQISPDGNIEIQVDDDYSENMESNGSTTIRRSLRASQYAIASINTTIQDSNSRPKHSLQVFMRDHKGTVTHIFNADASLAQEYKYDDFGARTSVNSGTGKPSDRSYENMEEDEFSGLIDFNARMYDPLLGRFTTPDTVLELEQAVLADGLNRMVFENNDPVNHIDPTGHMTQDQKIGLAIGIIALVVGVALTIASGGAASPLLMAVVAGTFIGAGSTAITYSVKHSDRTKGDFWKGFAAEVAIGAAIGAATGLITGGLGGALSKAAATKLTDLAVSKAGIWIAQTAIEGSVSTASAVAGSVVKTYYTAAVNDVLYNQKNEVTQEQLLENMKWAALTGGSVKGIGRVSKSLAAPTKSALSKIPWGKAIDALKAIKLPSIGRNFRSSYRELSSLPRILTSTHYGTFSY